MKIANTLALAVAAIGLAAATTVQAQTPPPYGLPISLENAKKCLAAAEAESRKNNFFMAIHVLDSGGNGVAAVRMDGTQIASYEIARQKAWSAVAYRRPTKAFEDVLAKGGDGLRVLRLEGAIPVEGGVTIVADGRIIGAVGASGGTAQQDGIVAAACLAALK